MKIGFIGTGRIATAIIQGMHLKKMQVKKIFISARNKKNSSFLKKKYKKVSVLNNNQHILHNSDIIFLTITPKVGKHILSKLQFKKNQTVFNLMSTIHNSELKKMIGKVKKIIKVAPLPMIEHGIGPIIIYPKDTFAENFFSKLGEVFSSTNEEFNKKLWVMTSFMATFLEIYKTNVDWLRKKGISEETGRKYLSKLFESLSKETLNNRSVNLAKFVKSFQTKGGINEQLLTKLRGFKFFNKLQNSLNTVYSRIKK